MFIIIIIIKVSYDVMFQTLLVKEHCVLSYYHHHHHHHQGLLCGCYGIVVHNYIFVANSVIIITFFVIILAITIITFMIIRFVMFQTCLV